jgi:ubiquitin carboxyl-terminal hydrolase 4/11/15
MKERSDSSEEEDNNEQSKKEEKKERIKLEELFKAELNLSDELNQGRAGLFNIGNTCFMNSGLQCLSNCYELTKYFLLDYYENDINLDNKLGSGGKIAMIYRKLLEDLWKGDQNSINPSYFKSIFAQFVRKFSGYAQQDSNEFLIYLLDKIHEDLNSISTKPYIEIEEKGKEESDEEASKRWWEKHLMRENSIIVDLFHGQFKSTITCNYCNRIAVNFDSYIFLSLPIPSGKFDINIKYFGYDINNFFELKIPITENTTVLNIIDIIKNKLSEKMYKERAISNPPRHNKKTRRKKNQRYKEIQKNEVISGDLPIELVLLTKNKSVYKVFNNNDYIFSYLEQGYELVAYEKKAGNENIYFYLTQYYKSFIFSLFYYPKIFLFNYPFPLAINKKDKINVLYGKISNYLKVFSPEKYKNEEAININSEYSQINKDNEKNNGFLIYLNIYLANKNNSICESIFSSKYINYPLLEKHSDNETINNFKKELCLKDEDRISIDINILFNLDKNKLPNLNINSEKLSFNKGKEINLYDCLNLFNSEEILDGDNEWYCNICKKHRDVNKKMDIFKTPYYLIIQLKRFKQDNEMGHRSIFNIFNSSKNSEFIDFPIKDFDLSKYILSKNNDGEKYDLIGVINHYGGSSFGHYTAYCLNGGQWLKYDDESVSFIDQKNVISNAAYVLFYKRRNNNKFN